MNDLHTVYAPIYENGRRNVIEIHVKTVRPVYNGKWAFINGQHYSDVYATRQEAENFWTRNGYAKPLTVSELLDLVKED